MAVMWLAWSGGVRASESRLQPAVSPGVVPASTVALGLPVGPSRPGFGREGDTWPGEACKVAACPVSCSGNRTQARETPACSCCRRETLLCSECFALWLQAESGFLRPSGKFPRQLY